MNDQDMNEMIAFLRNKTSLGRLNHGEVREVMRVLQEEHYTLEKKAPVKPYVTPVSPTAPVSPITPVVASPFEKPVEPEPAPAFDISKVEGHDVTV